jgi:hypothetical protein
MTPSTFMCLLPPFAVWACASAQSWSLGQSGSDYLHRIKLMDTTARSLHTCSVVKRRAVAPSTFIK